LVWILHLNFIELIIAYSTYYNLTLAIW